MKSNFLLIVLILSLISTSIQAQDNEDTSNKKDDLKVEVNQEVRDPIDPLAPSRAAFYSAILPGLGQAYNKKYWKIPIVYAALGTGIYFYKEKKNNLLKFFVL